MDTDTVDLSEQQLAELNGYETLQGSGDGHDNLSPALERPLVRIGNFPFHKDIYEGTWKELMS